MDTENILAKDIFALNIGNYLCRRINVKFRKLKCQCHLSNCQYLQRIKTDKLSGFLNTIKGIVKNVGDVDYCYKEKVANMEKAKTRN